MSFTCFAKCACEHYCFAIANVLAATEFSQTMRFPEERSNGDVFTFLYRNFIQRVQRSRINNLDNVGE